MLSDTHVTDEELVLDYHAELPAGERDRVRGHLTSCEACRRMDQELRALLRLVETAPPAEPPEGFERAMWARVAPQVTAARPGGTPGWRSRPSWQRWVLAGAMAAAVVAAFLVGRAGWPAAPPTAARADAGTSAVRERVLRAAVEDHLEQSQRVLTELVNTDFAAAGSVGVERARASDLVAAGRLYRLSAQGAGDAGMRALLEDLERVLLDVANSPPDAPRGQLRERIEQEDLVFRVRVVADNLRRQSRGQSAW